MTYATTSQIIDNAIERGIAVLTVTTNDGTFECTPAEARIEFDELAPGEYFEVCNPGTLRPAVTAATASRVVLLASEYIADWHRSVEEYADECAEHARNGHRPSHCFHGTYLWSVYDVMCHGCEGGDINQYSEPGAVRAWALDEARETIASEAREYRRVRRAAHGRILVMLGILRAAQAKPTRVAATKLAWEMIAEARATYAN